MTGMEEPAIIINGVTLSTGQAMALRVAASDFLMQMRERDALGDDETGREMAKGYHDRLSEILKIMGEMAAPADTNPETR